MAGATALAAGGLPIDAQTNAEGAFVMPPPKAITGGVKPLMMGHTARPLRYRPVDGDFVIRNGGEFFNRPLYGQNINFRVDAGDLPEFSFYLPGHGGNLKVGIASASGSKWLSQAAEVVARYRPGRMIYEIRDPLLGSGSLGVEALATGTGPGFMLRVETRDVPASVSLTWAFGGVSGRKGNRNGDIGCENEPVSKFFQVRAEECSDNRFTIGGNSALLNSPSADMRLVFPVGSLLRVADFSEWSEPRARSAAGLSILTGSVKLNSTPLLLTIQHLRGNAAIDWDARSKEVSQIAGTLKVATDDPWIDATGAALSIAADALWDAEQQCVMHGCVAWRGALAGWRGPYCLASLGNHERLRQQIRHWVKKQNVTPVSDAHSPVTGPPDPTSHLARKEGVLHQNGDISGNHYDMNMVFFDVFLRYLRWTGDVEFAREIWPAFERHLAWEQRLFRRDFGGLPLYEAYAAIWASDNLQYNGGGATHSSAYNLFAFRMAARLARALGEDAAPYEKEAALIAEGIEKHLWVSGQGAYAESKDVLGKQTVYTNPALWTVYHTIDSEAPSPRQAWQMVAERLAALKKIPVHGAGVPEGGWYLLSCSDWTPYLWSLNLLALGENMHTALAMWQAGLADEAFLLFKGNLLDSMYMGLAPGDFHMTSELDAHRQEAQRDFGDPTGMTARALTEGLFGFRPDMLNGTLTIRPGYPGDWKQASLRHPDLDFSFRREGVVDRYEINSRFQKPAALTLLLRARTTRLPKVSGGASAAFDPSAVGEPLLKLSMPAASSWKVEIEWSGEAPVAIPADREMAMGEPLTLTARVELAQIEDPQNCLAGGRTAVAGFHTVFANMRQGDCQWALPISFRVKEPMPFSAAPAPAGRVEPVDLTSLMKHQINEIFTRPYTEPRSPYCSLAIPEQLVGGWANMDMTAKVDDSGLRAAGGTLKTPLGVPFATPAGAAPNCLFVSQWKMDREAAEIALSGKAKGIYLLMTGVTFPQASRMEHGRVTVSYSDGMKADLVLRNPETWWPVEQDYLLDDYLSINDAPLPPRVDLRTGLTRILDAATFKGKGRAVNGGAASILYLPLNSDKALASMKVGASLYGIVIALLGATLERA